MKMNDSSGSSAPSQIDIRVGRTPEGLPRVEWLQFEPWHDFPLHLQLRAFEWGLAALIPTLLVVAFTARRDPVSDTYGFNSEAAPVMLVTMVVCFFLFRWLFLKYCLWSKGPSYEIPNSKLMAFSYWASAWLSVQDGALQFCYRPHSFAFKDKLGRNRPNEFLRIPFASVEGFNTEEAGKWFQYVDLVNYGKAQHEINYKASKYARLKSIRLPETYVVLANSGHGRVDVVALHHQNHIAISELRTVLHKTFIVPRGGFTTTTTAPPGNVV